MRVSVLFALLSLGATQAWAAEEPSGCDKFKWPIDRERAALMAHDRAQLASGNEVASLPSGAVTLALVATAAARLPTPPERAPNEATSAGFVKVTNAPKAGRYAVSLSASGWVDIVQDGRFLKPLAFSGATDCEGIRKSMKYELSAKPFVLQISGTKENSISIAILPSD